MATRKSTNRRTPAANKTAAKTVTKEEVVDDSKVVEETEAPEPTETKVEPDQSGGDAEGAQPILADLPFDAPDVVLYAPEVEEPRFGALLPDFIDLVIDP